MKRTFIQSISALILAISLAGCAAPAVIPASPTPESAAVSIDTPSGSRPSATPPQNTPTTHPTSQPTRPAELKTPANTAAHFPDPALYTWQAVASGLKLPVSVTGDGQGRLLVIQQHGNIVVIENGQLRSEPFIDLGDRIGASGNEQGLLGIALSPNYSQNGFFYVNYTGKDGNTVIARFTADPVKATANPGSQKILLRVKQPYPNHNGGSMVFGPDSYLYMGLGDGGSAGDPHGNGQNLNTYLGKLLRIDVNQGDPYTIPPDNPFQSNGKPEIWAYGLRNPWRFSFDRATGDLYIGDVGQDAWEEIDFLPAGSKGGADFGWNYLEGTHSFKGSPPATLALVDPVYEYKHPEGCSVTGGYVYRGQALPDFQGVYLYSDYCTGKIYGLMRDATGKWQNKLLFETGTFISSFGEDSQGELYATVHRDGILLKLVKK